MALAPLLNTGFESGLLAAHGGTIVSAGVTVTSGAARNGTYGLHIVATNSAQVSWDTPAYSAPTKFVGRLAVKLSSRPGGTGSSLLAFTTAGGSGFNVKPTGELAAIFGGTEVVGAVIDTTNFHLLEWQCDTVAKTMDWRIDGAPQPRVTSAGTPAVGTVARFGSFDNTQFAYTADVDDVIFGSWTVAADWYGEGRGLGILPAADGTHVFTTGDFSPGDAGTTQASTWNTAWQNVIALPFTTVRSTTVNIAQRVGYTTNTAHYVELVPAAADIGTAKGNALTGLIAYSSSGTTANTMGTAVGDSGGAVIVLWGNLNNACGGTGGTVSPFGTADYSESTNFFKTVPIAAPAAGWTKAEIAALRWRTGSSTDVSPIPTVQTLMFEVDYPTAAAIASRQQPLLMTLSRAGGA